MPAPVSEAQIRAIYAETVDPLYAFISRRCNGNRALAEDITQEAWLRAIRHWPHGGVPGNPLAWLIIVARNLLSNERRRGEREAGDAVNADALMAAMDDGAPQDSEELAQIVKDAVARLPETQARLIEAFHYQRARVSQIAADFGMSERAVEGRLRRARASLRRELELTLNAEG
jgi:RNA polymerase sigma-70 factor (ECF subfamily)